MTGATLEVCLLVVHEDKLDCGKCHYQLNLSTFKKQKETSMSKSLRLCLATFLLTLSLTASAFAGDGHCPLVEPPPDNGDGRMAAPIVQTTNPSEAVGFQFIKGFWEILLLKKNLFQL